VKFVGFAAVMFPKSVIEKVGLLDENYFFYNEELDYLKRVRQQGYECWYVPAAEIVHFGGQSTKSRRYDFELEGLKGGIYFVSKFYPWMYPLYRGVFGLLAVGLQIVAPMLLLSVQSKADMLARGAFYRNVLKLAWGFRIGQYVPRKYFD
jgi:GT2 family glycosyltransferase